MSFSVFPNFRFRFELDRKCSTGNLSHPNGNTLPILWGMRHPFYTHNTLLSEFVSICPIFPTRLDLTFQYGFDSCDRTILILYRHPPDLQTNSFSQEFFSLSCSPYGIFQDRFYKVLL